MQLTQKNAARSQLKEFKLTHKLFTVRSVHRSVQGIN